MKQGEFIPPDIISNWPEVRIDHLPLKMIHLLARRAPTIVHALDIKQRRELGEYISKSRDIGATNMLLRRMLAQLPGGISVKCRRIEMSLLDLIGQESIEWLEGHNGVARNILLAQLQRMIFSEKSSFAQSGISIACVAEDVRPNNVFHTVDELKKAKVSLVIASVIDIIEHEFLAELIKRVKGKVGRLLDLGEPVLRTLLEDEYKVGAHVSPDDILWNQLEIMIGDKKQRYRDPRVDNSGALIVPLCPYQIYDEEKHDWRDADMVKVYNIEEEVVQNIVDGWSRKGLKKRTSSLVPQTDVIKPWQTRILEIPLDSGPYNANIGVVCVWPDGREIDVIHFPATYLDAVRSFPDGENRIQVEIKNVGSKDIQLKDIHFRVKFYQTDLKTRKKWELRKALQYAEFKWYYALEHLIYTKVLKGSNEWDLSDCMLALGDLSNMDNLCWNEQGILLYQNENNGHIEDRIECISYSSEALSLRPIGITEIRRYCTTHQRELLWVLQNACSVGREKRVILICRNDINHEGLMAIAKVTGVTDILSVPGKRNAPVPNNNLVKMCEHEKIKLTSIDVVEPGTPQSDAMYNLLGARRPK